MQLSAYRRSSDFDRVGRRYCDDSKENNTRAKLKGVSSFIIVVIFFYLQNGAMPRKEKLNIAKSEYGYPSESTNTNKDESVSEKVCNNISKLN